MNISQLLCIILAFKSVVTKRISELSKWEHNISTPQSVHITTSFDTELKIPSKCSEAASLDTDERSLNPYLMNLFDTKDAPEFELCIGTLISEEFVLVSPFQFKNERLTNYRVGKVILKGETYSIRELFRILRYIPNRLTDGSISNNFGLVQLTEKVPYQAGKSFYRPACLWPYETISPWLIYSTIDITLATSSVQLEKCNTFPTVSNKLPQSKIASFFCFNSSELLHFYHGNPIVAKDSGQYYVVGIASQAVPGAVIYGPKIYSEIDWIESVVWPPSLDDISCGQQKIKHRPLLTFALPTYHGEFPWHVALLKQNHTYICGGTIINNRTIVTAAHCVYDARGLLPPNRLTVVAGTYSLSDYPNEARIYSIEEIVVHQNYSSTFLENDIALLKVSGLIKFSHFIQPICLSNDLDYSNITSGHVAGWGRDENNLPSDELLQVTLPIIDDFECRDSDRDFFPNYLNPHNYCAGYDNGTSVCFGDSGGGMVFKHNSRWYIRGLVSLGVALPNLGLCDFTKFALFTDVPKLYNWIIENSQP